MIVVADSTPLIALSRIGRLQLLERLYTRVVIPRAVFDEVVEQGHDRPGASEVSHSRFIEVGETATPIPAPPLRKNLGAGELAAIELALQLKADLLLVDDLPARREAMRQGLTIIGTVGILQQAKLASVVPALKPELRALINHDFHLSERMFQEACAAVGET